MYLWRMVPGRIREIVSPVQMCTSFTNGKAVVMVLQRNLLPTD